MYNNINTLNILLNKKLININTQNNNGDTPLHIAIQTSNIDICKLLVKINDIKNNIINQDDKTQQILANETNDEEIITLINSIEN